MEIYLVGGAVRDQLLGLPVKEKDWVVVGATVKDMLKQGFEPVGKEFPVFLHPETHEEYALARTERKTGKGYKGFVFYTDPSVTLEQDLARRDLTINAIAQDKQGNLIDPFHGQRDLKNQILRHVSAAFAEDPVRILRLARFSARFPDFTIDAHTTELMRLMVKNGEVDALVPERVWQEFFKAMTYAKPQNFFAVLDHCGALAKLFPEIQLSGTEIKPQDNAVIYFACLLYELQLDQVKDLCARYRIPNEFADLAKLAVRFKQIFKTLSDEKPRMWLDFILQADALRRPQRFADLIKVLHIQQPRCEDKIVRLANCIDAVNAISTTDLQQQGLSGQAFANVLYQKRLYAVEKILA